MMRFLCEKTSSQPTPGKQALEAGTLWFAACCYYFSLPLRFS